MLSALGAARPPARAPPVGTHVMTSVSSPGSLSSPSTNTDVLVKLCVLQVTPSSTLNLSRRGVTTAGRREHGPCPGPAALLNPALPEPGPALPS